jgi:hypothetical protein
VLKKGIELRASIIKLLVTYKGVGKKGETAGKNTSYNITYKTIKTLFLICPRSQRN